MFGTAHWKVGYVVLGWKLMSLTTYMMLVLPKKVVRYMLRDTPHPFQNSNELKLFEQWNYCAGTAMFLHTILLLKRILTTNKKEKEMFEITYNDSDMLERFQDCGKAYDKGVYDFTFEGRFIIYHAPLRHMVDYIALDTHTGLESAVKTVRPNNLLTKASYRKLIPDIIYSIKYTGDKRYISKITDNAMEVIETIFRFILPENGYTVREEQISLSKKMFVGFTEKQVAICEAEVGTGKTLSYLVAAFCAKVYNEQKYKQHMPVTITTATIELQKALVEKEIPNLSNLLMKYGIINKPLTVVLRKGKEHYICPFRLNDHLDNLKLYPKKYSQTIELLKEIKRMPYGIDLDKYQISGSLKSKICVKGSCKGCKLKDTCKYNEFSTIMYNLPGLDFQVTNHNMYLMSQKTRSDDHPPLLRESCFVVVDEAHKFKEAAEDTFGACISEQDVEKYYTAVKNMCATKKDKPLYDELLATMRVENADLFKTLRRLLKKNDMDDDRGSIIHLSSYQTARIKRILCLVERVEELKQKQNYGIPVTGYSITSALYAILKTTGSIIWLNVDENDVLCLCQTPTNINSVLRNKVWDRDVSHVLTSGTMSDGTDFEFFKSQNGLDRIPKHLLLESRTESPFDYQAHARLYIPKFMPTPDNSNKEYIQAVADECFKIIKATNGHTAILFTSYKVLQSVHDLLEEKLTDYDIICMTRGNRTAITDFKKSKNGILFASGSMWEGVDCAGDCLSSVIIVRLPFPMRSAIMEEKKDKCEDTFDFVNKYCIPNMLIKLRQGVGRLIRCESDTGVVSILDPRANLPAYRAKVNVAMQKFPRVKDIREMSGFMKSVKDTTYFDKKGD